MNGTNTTHLKASSILVLAMFSGSPTPEEWERMRFTCSCKVFKNCGSGIVLASLASLSSSSHLLQLIRPHSHIREKPEAGVDAVNDFARLNDFIDDLCAGAEGGGVRVSLF